MSRTACFVVSLGVLIAAKACDLIVTFHFDPSLAREGNPVVILFGGGRGAFFVAALAPSAAVAGALFVFWLGPSLAWAGTPPRALSSFTGSWLKRVALARQPFRSYLRGGTHSKEGVQAIRLFAVGLAWALIFGSLVAAYAWSALYHSHSAAFKTTFQSLSLGRFSILPTVAAFFGFAFGATMFFSSEKSKIASQDLKSRRCAKA